MRQTEHCRKIDANGRIIIPSQLRDELNIKAGDIHNFFIHEFEGKTYLCIECYNLESEVERAKRILREAGIKVED
jgi:AbrB family looped-hinge helix DNA binding protein